MSDRTPTTGQLLKKAIRHRLLNLHTALPAKVENYDPADQRVDVLPMVKRSTIDDDGEIITEELPVISDVPLMFPRSGEFFLSLPIKKGDLVMLVFQEASIDEYTDKQGDSPEDPQDLRRHDLTDAVAIPGFYPFKKALGDAHADNLVLGHDGGVQMHMKTAGTINLGSENPVDAVGLASLVKAELDKLVTEINAIVTVMNANVIIYNTHTHPATPPALPTDVSGPPSAPETPAVTAAPASPVASTVVLSD